MATTEEIHAAQSHLRRRLVESWPIKPGHKVLEIGCGQGDMTEVLAEAVGPQGHVTAVDIADPSYGAPLTLAEATNIIRKSKVGQRIDFRFNFNVLDAAIQFDPNSFDAIVMAHSSWYFASPALLSLTLEKMRPWAKQLFFAEWDLQLHHESQLAHFMAITIQKQVEALRTESSSNVRTPLSKPEFEAVLKRAGWEIRSEKRIDSPALQDADWEISTCLSTSLTLARDLSTDQVFIGNIEKQLAQLRQVALTEKNRALSCYSLVARRPD